jgi:hypothetical protein
MGLLFLLDHGHDVVFAHDHEVFAVDLDFSAGVLAEEHLVVDLEVERADFAGLEDLALADRNDLAADRLFGRRVRNYDAARGLALFLGAPDNNAIV